MTMDQQDIIRKRLNDYIEKHGTKAKWVAEKCGNIDQALLSRFRSGKKNLWPKTLEVVENFLDHQEGNK